MVETYGRAKAMLRMTSTVIAGLNIPSQHKVPIQDALNAQIVHLDNRAEESVWEFLEHSANFTGQTALPRHEVYRNLARAVKILSR